MNDTTRRLYSAAQVRELERAAIAGLGIAGHLLMQRAASACFRELRARWPAARKIHIVCGPGNNGGDGYEIAHLAKAAGLSVSLWQIGGAPASGDAVTTHAGWVAEDGHRAPWQAGCLSDAELIVDAIFGIGIARAVTGDAAAAIAEINAREVGVPVVAVDVPSGLDADCGQPQGLAVRADLTVSLIGAKPGLYTAAGPDHAGERVLDRLGLPDALFERQPASGHLLAADDLSRWLPRRPRDAHKGRHGHVLLIGGDAGMGGAILLAARAALRCGAGLVTVATRGAHAAQLTAAQPEAMFRAIESAADLAPLLERADVVAIGPGLGQQDWGRAMWAAVLSATQPLVVDADALNLLAEQPQTCNRPQADELTLAHEVGEGGPRAERVVGEGESPPVRSFNSANQLGGGLSRDWVLTPHPGEAARLLGCATVEIQADRIGAVTRLRQRYGGTVVIKGAGSLIRAQALALCPYGNPGMGSGGVGDVLTGVIAALRAQGLDAETAAQAGVLVHALAGDRAAVSGERGLLPGDLIAELRGLVNP